jgi:DNA recombination protein RmuC
LQEKSQRFGAENREQMDLLLKPLRQTIDGLQQNIQQQLTEETKQRSELRTQIDQLQQLNQQLSADAQNLVSAMRGDSKKQGDWGEWQLEMLLERAGLTRDVHFSAQLSLFDDEQRQKRPDFVIHLPDSKHLIIDSKVSLTAYERFFNENDAELQQKQLAQHVMSLREHIKNLGGKKYAALSNVNAPEYVLLFVPIEPALTTALQTDPQLFNDALDRNIILVSVTTLLATMRTVAFTWKQENQKKNVLEIAWQSGLLYDKFVLFIEDLKRIGVQLDGAQSAYHDAFNKLQNSPKYGDTLIGRAEKIRQLGAKNQKNLPPELLDS